MKTLLKNGSVVNVFLGMTVRADVLLEDGKIIGVGDYANADADIITDVSGKFICPGFIDGHIHIESTMLLPAELARICVPHGTTAIVTDPHEIANVCGTAGIDFMLQTSEGLPMTVYVMLPSCVPATPFDESGAVLEAADLRPYYTHPRVLGLAEMMNYPGVLADDPSVLQKIRDAYKKGRPVDGHAPLLSGRELDKYIAAGVRTDHECSSFEEAAQRVAKGQWVMIREGTAARNLSGLLPLFEPPYAHRCLLVTDDKHPADLIQNGHIDAIIREAVKEGKSAVTAIQMATIQAAQCFSLRDVGAIAPGYIADLLVLDDLDTVAVRDVYRAGKRVVENGRMCAFEIPRPSEKLSDIVRKSFCMNALTAADFHIEQTSGRCRIIKLVPGQLLTDEWITEVTPDHNGIDVSRDILKLAVVERHRRTGHIGLGYVSGMGLKHGAVAQSVSHDSHNLIVVGANDEDMALAADRVRAMGGGVAIADGGKVIGEMPLPVAGLMGDGTAHELAAQNARMRELVHTLGVPAETAPLMSMSFISLPVIPSLKMTTQGLVDVNRQERVSLFV